MRTVPQTALPAIRSAAAAIVRQLNANEPAFADMLDVLVDPAAYDADDLAWMLDQAAEATAEHTEDGFVPAEITTITEAAILAIG